MTKSFRILFGLAAWIIACSTGLSAELADSKFAATVAPILKTYCVTCHGGKKPKSDLSLEVSVPDFPRNAEIWNEVVDRLTEGSMPPKGKPRPTAVERAAVTDYLAAGLSDYQAERMAVEGRARLRRLNRIEYVNTMRDLLGVEVDIEALPEDGIAGGFDNVDMGLDLSATLVERYLEAADKALEEVLADRPRPQTTTKHVDLISEVKHSTYNGKSPRFGSTALIRDHDVVFRTGGAPNDTFHEARVTVAGRYRVRVSANAHANGKGMIFLAYAGNYGSGALLTRKVGAFDVTDKPTMVEFFEEMSAGESIRIAPYGLPMVYRAPPADYAGPGFAMQWIEVEGPLIDVWPPVGKTRLLGDVDLAKGTLADAEAILRRFAPRAFRRKVTDEDLAPYIDLVKSQLGKGDTFAVALRTGLKAVLCSPDFLYMSATPGRLDDFDLATRLSYFLWSTTPDDALTDLAARGELGKRDVLRQHVERMLNDPRAHAFTENFTGQWLNLRDLKATIPDKKLYPEFDDYLELSMPVETHLFFEELVTHDRSLLEFINSDWAILDARLATHYNIPGVTGAEFRKVPLPKESHRGGVLTQAAVLKVTANGTHTSPVIRGAWMLKQIFGTPSPPPPKDVPALEPDVRGTTTMREQLAKHRQLAQCATCHTKIDPPGNALENFDVIGGWRQWYRTVPAKGLERDKVMTPNRYAVQVGKGPNVDAADELPGGRKFSDIEGLKKLLLEDPDPFARCLTEKLLVYATGHKLEFSDRRAVERIVADIREKNYGFRTLIHAIVESPSFRSK